MKCVCKYGWLSGLGVWFALRVREVPGSNPGWAHLLLHCRKIEMILLTFHLKIPGRAHLLLHYIKIGNDFINISLKIFFSISDITSHTVVNPGDDAEMVCTIDANPIKENTVQWTRYKSLIFTMIIQLLLIR